MAITKTNELFDQVIFISDVHFGKGNIEKLQIMKDYFDNFFIPFVKQQKKSHNPCIVIAGDYFDNRQNIDINVDGNNHGTTLKTKIYQVTFKDNTVKDLIDKINSSIAGKLEPVQNVINKINSAANSYDSNIVPAINNLLKRIESGIHNANKLLQPAMMYQDAKDNWHFVSTDNHFATALVGRGATELVATSYTGEYLAPAYKKTLEVNGGATITLPNGKSAEKVSGDCHKFIFNASDPGKYTVVYKAVDYSGKEVVKNFYITVK